jgi:hypothetical protein
MGTRSKLKRAGEIVVSLLPVSLYCLDIACGVPGGGGGGGEVGRHDPHDDLPAGVYDAPCHADARLSEAMEGVADHWSTTIEVDAVAKTLVRTDSGFADDSCATPLVRLVMAAQYDLSNPAKEGSHLDARIFPYDTKLTPLSAEAAGTFSAADFCGATFTKAKATPITDEDCAVDYDFAAGHYLYGVIEMEGTTAFRLGETFVREGEEVPVALSPLRYTDRRPEP